MELEAEYYGVRKSVTKREGFLESWNSKLGPNAMSGRSWRPQPVAVSRGFLSMSWPDCSSYRFHGRPFRLKVPMLAHLLTEGVAVSHHRYMVADIY